MKRFYAALLASTAIMSASIGHADAPGLNDPFFWIGEEPASPPQSEVQTPINGDMQRSSFAVEKDEKPQQAVKETAGPQIPLNPVLDDYPTEDAPTPATTQGNIFADDGCAYPTSIPETMNFATPRQITGERGITPQDRRRGEMAGDDGVLSAIQDSPCADIMRRGGETPGSLNKHLREGDIRRANTLEDRRIPTHSVGRYSPEGSGLWYREASDPFIDSAHEWEVRSGETLSQLLRRWSDDAGFTLVYQTDTDYVLQANVIIRGTFSEASGKVIESFANASPPISAEYFLGNKVIVVRSANEFDGR